MLALLQLEKLHTIPRYEDFCNGETAFFASATIVPYEGTAISGTVQLPLNGENYTLNIAPYYLPATFREEK